MTRSLRIVHAFTGSTSLKDSGSIIQGSHFMAAKLLNPALGMLPFQTCGPRLLSLFPTRSGRRPMGHCSRPPQNSQGLPAGWWERISYQDSIIASIFNYMGWNTGFRGAGWLTPDGSHIPTALGMVAGSRHTPVSAGFNCAAPAPGEHSAVWPRRVLRAVRRPVRDQLDHQESTSRTPRCSAAPSSKGRVDGRTVDIPSFGDSRRHAVLWHLSIFE